MTDFTSPVAALQGRIRAASASGNALRIRGSGSKDFYGQSLQGELLGTHELQGILSYEPSELVVTVASGTPLALLETTLAGHGQCLAFEPPHFGPAATVGGMVAAGLAGPARANVGGVRDFVLGAELINGQGEVLTFGGQVMKNVAGYDVSRALAGSLGTLGLITQVSLKVLPFAPAEATLAMQGLSQQDALALLHHWGGQPLPLSASAWVHDTHAEPGEPTLYVRLRGARAAVDAALPRLCHEAQARGAQTQQTDAAADWRASAEHQIPFLRQAPHAQACLWRLSVPQTTPALSWPGALGAPYVEWHGGQRWVWAPASAAQALRQAVQQVGGHACLFRVSAEGGEADRAVGVFHPLDPVQARLQSAVKRAFDPHGVFGPGRDYPAS